MVQPLPVMATDEVQEEVQDLFPQISPEKDQQPEDRRVVTVHPASAT